MRHPCEYEKNDMGVVGNLASSGKRQIRQDKLLLKWWKTCLAVDLRPGGLGSIKGKADGGIQII